LDRTWTELFLALFLFAGVVSAQQHPRTFSVPFHTAGGMILLEAQANGKPAVLLLDTGAQTTVISPKLANVRSKDSRAFATVVQGVRAHANLLLSADLNYSGDFYVLDFSETSKQLGAKIDGLLGQNILRDFSAFRVDYKANVIEFEK